MGMIITCLMAIFGVVAAICIDVDLKKNEKKGDDN
jgi:hypothetical protein